jgi:hypothetical protein
VKFRVKHIDLVRGGKQEFDYDDVVSALRKIDSLGWDLNSNLFKLLMLGFLTVEGDESSMVMLLGRYAGGTEDLICHPLVARQMGAEGIPMFVMPFAEGVRDDGAGAARQD